ncbi:MAG: HPP family protein [Alphaproteobacteria bacterium]|nr:HPP family protein [Alphaproteobacteria bacterium]
MLKQLLQGFTPRIAGASARERLIASFGAFIGIAATGVICGWVGGMAPPAPLLVAPMGASAVLLFAVPSSPLAQPWSIVGGNTLSALAGIAAIHLIPQPVLAAAVAVASAIALMSALRCLHPPGGAVALLVALMGPSSAAASVGFALLPVGLNSLVIMLVGLVFHRFSGHQYPHVQIRIPANTHGTADLPSRLRYGLSDGDIETAVRESGETFDIGQADLARLIRRAERAALERTRTVPRCAEIMSRDVVTISPGATPLEARRLLIERGLRMLPVVGEDNQVLGAVGLRNLDPPAERVADIMSAAAVAAPGDSILGLVELLTDGPTHAVVIVEPGGRLAGLVTQTDLVAALAQLAVFEVTKDGKPAH